MSGSREIQAFVDEVWEYYGLHGRTDLPWRQPASDGSFDAYRILVSEIMLQQTQVARVIPKFEAFMQQFPTVQSLAKADLGDVLVAWNGLGYNRRAKFLWQAARLAQTNYDGIFPADQKQLTKFPGIGVNTAGAVLAYAYNQSVVFVETNIRTVFIHHFYDDQTGIDDKQILELVVEALQAESPREWYWALMDYGSYLKQTVGNLNHASKHYTKQSTFKGSRREIRGKIITLLTERSYDTQELAVLIDDERYLAVVDDLVAEQLIRRSRKQLSI